MHNIACLTCSRLHSLPDDPRQALASAQGFVERHPEHEFAFDLIRAAEMQSGHLPKWAENADIKVAYGSVVSMTVTALHSQASSTTAGWNSAAVDNTADLFLDQLGIVELDFANTAPANSFGVYIFAYGGIETGEYPNPATGSEGDITFTDVTTTPQNMPQVAFLNYRTQNEVATSRPFSIAAGFGGILPPFWGLALVNHSGAALAASLNYVKHRGVFATAT